jgi:hypothetical protein
MKKLTLVSFILALCGAARADNFTSWSVDGQEGVRITSTAVGMFQILLPDPVIGERPQFGSINSPLSGFSTGNGVQNVINNGTANVSWGRHGDGALGQVFNAGTGLETQMTEPTLENEGNHDGIYWIDNRAPDGVFGHDPSGRFLLFDVGGTRIFRVGNSGVGIGTPIISSTLTVNGPIESKNGGYKFPNGSIQLTAATGGSQVICFSTGSVGQIGNGPTVLDSCAVPASSLVHVGSILKIKAWGHIVVGGPVAPQLKFGSTIIWDNSTDFTSTASAWALTATVIKTGPSMQKFTSDSLRNNEFSVDGKSGSASEIDTSTITISGIGVGLGAADGSIIQDGLVVELEN